MSDNHDLHDDRISRLYKMGEQPEPPERIDDEIKRAAREATTVRKRSYAWPSLATAAVLVLSISLVLKVLEQKPLEESVMEPLSTEDQIAPEVMLQESEDKAADIKDREEPKLQRYRAIKKRAAPAPQRRKSEGAVQLDVVPKAAIGGAVSIKAKPLDCSGITLPETDSKEEWIKQYQKVRKLGQLETARCLKQAYQARFNQAMPEF